MVSSKYKISQFIILFIVLSLMIYLIILTMHKAPMYAAFIFFLAIGSLFITFFKSPLITFEENSIRRILFFRSTIYKWDDVENVSLGIQEDYSILLIFGRPMAAMKLIFKDGKSLVVWEHMYSNMVEMRTFVTQKLNDKLHFLTSPDQRNVQQIIVDKRYAGNVFISFNTLLIVGMTIFFIVQLQIKPGKELLLLIPLFFIIFLYLINGLQMNFFEIQYDKLIIKNQYFPWKRKEYNIIDIEEVSKERPYRRSDGLRIITYEFKSKFFGAGSLRNHNWEELFNDLKSMGIKINN